MDSFLLLVNDNSGQLLQFQLVLNFIDRIKLHIQESERFREDKNNKLISLSLIADIIFSINGFKKNKIQIVPKLRKHLKYSYWLDAFQHHKIFDIQI